MNDQGKAGSLSTTEVNLLAQMGELFWLDGGILFPLCHHYQSKSRVEQVGAGYSLVP